MITDIKVETKKKSNKEQIKKIKLWQLRLESLATPTPNKALNNYSKELSNIKMHAISKDETICMNRHKSLSKRINSNFLKHSIEMISLYKKNTRF